MKRIIGYVWKFGPWTAFAFVFMLGFLALAKNQYEIYKHEEELLAEAQRAQQIAKDKLYEDARVAGRRLDDAEEKIEEKEIEIENTHHNAKKLASLKRELKDLVADYWNKEFDLNSKASDIVIYEHSNFVIYSREDYLADVDEMEKSLTHSKRWRWSRKLNR